MKLEYIQQADIILSKCGRPQLPLGVSAVPLYRTFVMPMVLSPGGAVTFTKEITGGAPWVLRAISSDQTASVQIGIRMQVQLPNGRFLFGGNGIDVGQFCWVGSWRWLQDPELRCEPGGKLQVTLTDVSGGNITQATPVNLTFEGAYLYFMRGGRLTKAPPLASSLPRYQGIVNENILAPAWMSNEGLQTPDGYYDENFIYATPEPVDQPQQTTWTIVAGAVTVDPNPTPPFEIQIDPGEDFFVRRILTDVEVTGTAFAAVLSKFRTGGGYVLNDNYIDASRYFGNSVFGGLWKVKGVDSVFTDCQLVDVTGDGTLTVQVFLDGYRRRQK